MRKIPHSRPTSVLADGLIFLLVGTVIYGLANFSAQWQMNYNPNYQIDLSLQALPLYALFSALRGFIAYLISLAFTLTVGYWAAKSPAAARLILPFLDIMQSIPVLIFLPGIVLSLVAIFPHSNVGLELASILMIFTGQVWNMAFAFYSSLKSVPNDLKEAASVMKLTSMQRLRLLELPYSAMNLTWNSVMSMAGGWFFLTVCEAFTMGDRAYRLPGVGAYMAVAIEAGNTQAIIGGIIAMGLIILLFDQLLWRPALMWAHRFRLEDSEEQKVEEPLIQLLVRESFLVRFLRIFYFRPRMKRERSQMAFVPWRGKAWFDWQLSLKQLDYLGKVLLVVVSGLMIYGTIRLFALLTSVSWIAWLQIIRDTGFTFLRVMAALVIGTLWATPCAIWIVQSSRRLRIAQPIIQLMASYPAPMLYPLAMAVFLFLHINFEISSMLLMLLGVQWYILFNVLAGALRIPTELKLCMDLMKSSKAQRWRFLFLPSVLPSLVTGWVTAAGGAWNTCIVAEVITYKGQTLHAHGLGARITDAVAHGDFPMMAACATVMIIFVVLFNRAVWSRLYAVAQLRFRMDL
jgi:NitT/TauT family transport system permease protein